VADAYKTSAAQAQAMSERSMDTMSNVAATASRGPQQVVYTDPRRTPPPPAPTQPVPDPKASAAPPARPAYCGSCGKPVDAAAASCQHCGKPRE